MTIGGVPFLPMVGWSLRDPQEAARHIIALNFPREALWSILALACVANALLTWGVGLVTPPLPPEFQQSNMLIIRALSNPILMFVFSVAALVIFIHVLHWASAALGGTGTLNSVLSAFVWLQILRILAQAGSIILYLIAPPLAALYGLVVMLFSLWVTVNFINQGTGLDSILKTIGLVFAVMVGIVFGIVFFTMITGLASMGLEQNV